MAASCVLAALKLDAGGIVVVNDASGDVTRLISKYRPSIPVLAVVDSVKVARQLSLHRSVYPTMLPHHKALSAAVEQGLLENKDNVVVVNVSLLLLLPLCFWTVLYYVAICPHDFFIFFLCFFQASGANGIEMSVSQIP